jgi:hypothetical protein
MNMPASRVLRLVSDQLHLELDRPPSSSDEFLERLRGMGLRGIDRCVLTRNRSVMISFQRGTLRLHSAYLTAPEEIHRAIMTFVGARTRRMRQDAQRVILEYPISLDEMRPRRQPLSRPRPSDIPLMEELARRHDHYNAMLFGGGLSRIPIRISGRMRRRLGQYVAPCESGRPAEITISRRHIRRHGWEETLHTLLHEMVHQWQAENGMPIDHGPEFRRKAIEVGIDATARRVVRVDTAPLQQKRA